MRAAFVVTSALHTKYGVFSSRERLAQTLASLDSIEERCPGARIILVEMGGKSSPTKDERSALEGRCFEVVDYSGDADVRKISADTNDWDVVKSQTEMLCFGRFLKSAKRRGIFKDCGRIFKLSGRYALSEHFDPRVHEALRGKIAFKKKQRSQFPAAATDLTPAQFMSRLWSFDAELLDFVIARYELMLAFMTDRVEKGGYVDIEHCLWRFMPPDRVHELERAGVAGYLGPSGTRVED
jgi:hypothetical protein